MDKLNFFCFCLLGTLVTVQGNRISNNEKVEKLTSLDAKKIATLLEIILSHKDSNVLSKLVNKKSHNIGSKQDKQFAELGLATGNVTLCVDQLEANLTQILQNIDGTVADLTANVNGLLSDVTGCLLDVGCIVNNLLNLTNGLSDVTTPLEQLLNDILLSVTDSLSCLLGV